MVTKQHKKLLELQQHQKEILVCYRPTLKKGWGDRTMFLSDDYDENKPYNHRTILDKEIVIEYDDEDKEINRKYTDEVGRRMSEDDIKWAKLTSGNKSTHLHTLLDINGAMNLSLLKNAFIRYYTQSPRWKKTLPLPDMGLCGNRLIRLEHGVHEKTGRFKTPVYTITGYGEKLDDVPQPIWNLYDKMYERVQKWKSTMVSKELANSEQVKLILDTVRFNKYGDGRERALFILIHMTKDKYKKEFPDNEHQGKEALTKFLSNWYQSSRGYKLTNIDIAHKVSYHYNRSYSLGMTYINTFLEELGITEYSQQC